MTTRDGIGSPRRREVIERDEAALQLIHRRAAEGLCTRLIDIRRSLTERESGLSRGQCYYVVKRLEAAGHIERRAGYLWCIAEDGLA
jgi:DNA-binding PadR family transcriptional regulator